MHSERAPFFLKLAAWGGVVFLHFPILIIAAYAFNTEDAAFSFPPQGLTLRWFSVAAQRSDILDSVTLSLKGGAGDINRAGVRDAGSCRAVATRLFRQKRHFAVTVAAHCAAGHCHWSGAINRL